MSPSLGAPTNGKFAREVKLDVPRDRLADVLRWAREHLEPDTHGAGAEGDSYRVSTVYFDTPDLDVFHGRGSFARTKYRIRRYGESPIVFAERKLKVDSRVSKRRTAVPIDQLGSPAADAPWSWFDERVRLRGLRPVCRISYQRVARIGEAEGGAIRFTIDRNIHARRTTGVNFTADSGIPLAEDRLIVELKYRHEMPAIFRDFVNTFALEPRACSKYKLAVPALRLRQPDWLPTGILCVA